MNLTHERHGEVRRPGHLVVRSSAQGDEQHRSHHVSWAGHGTVHDVVALPHPRTALYPGSDVRARSLQEGDGQLVLLLRPIDARVDIVWRDDAGARHGAVLDGDTGALRAMTTAELDRGGSTGPRS
ncbi:hypothetical protein INN71_02305 [Nocardioides sp. ChNu-153]|uniref:hypothetical protein n=1 Tax=unclassified Nocardioides TaxID=2615069 RepID=UPI0024066A72|nr:MULTISPECIES: hypothetical protein [unclassified Nocardioides]MDF9716831.1 hypothetical protein [Nocardioides sp. ChNu-99]MDN7120217.1 hypothetical protein [Nocardioides sp. ChNu-153]